MEPETCTKMLKKLSEKLRANFPDTTHDVPLEIFLTASKPSRRSITAAKRKGKEKNERQEKN